MTWFDWRRPARHPVGGKRSIDEQEFSVIDLGRDVSRDLRSHIDKAIGIHGKPFETGGVLSPAFFPIAGAGAGMASSLFAGNVFLATANPATLMQIGAGVGAAVMGPAGVIAHAPVYCSEWRHNPSGCAGSALHCGSGNGDLRPLGSASSLPGAN